MTWRPAQFRKRGRSAEARLDKELRFHLEQHAQDLISRGVNPVEARRQAQMSLGGVEQVKEGCRDERRSRRLGDVLQDARYALRLLGHKPGFAAVTLLTLALGIGTSTVMFTVIHSVLLKPLPYADPQQLVRVNGQTETWNARIYGAQNVAYPDFVDSRKQSGTVDLAGWLWDASTISDPGEPDHVVHVSASANLFSVLGVRMAQGRDFLPDDDRPGGAPVAIVSDAIWRNRFGGTPAAIGARLLLDTRIYTVVGVAPAGFQLDGDADVYTPLGQNPLPILQRRGPHPINVVGRLRPGATVAQANTELQVVSRRLATQYPDTNAGRALVASPLRPDVGDVGATLWMLLGAVMLVLLIACANVASLLLARAISRERELAMRVALGAGRARLFRQCLTESAVLGLGGGVLGVAAAWVGLRPFVVLWPGTLPRAAEISLDWRVLLLALGVSLMCGLLFGLAPALRAPIHDVERTLRAGSRAVTRGSRRLHASFVVSEIALAMVLLACAGALGRTLLQLQTTDSGLDTRNVLTARTAVSPSMLDDPRQTRAAWQDLLDRVRQIHGVLAVAMVDTVPMRAGNNQIGYRLSAAPVPDNQQPVALATSVTPDYLAVMKVPLRQGRFITDQDRLTAPSVVVIDEVMARQAFGGQDPLGNHVWINLGADPATVVGVVGHVRHWGLAGDDQSQVRAQLYYPFAQVPDALVRRWSDLMSIAVRTDSDPAGVVAPLRRAVLGDTHDQVIYQVRSLEDLARASIAPQRFLLLLFGMFATMAVALACIGIYGVLAYLTSQRLPEMSVRMALGASEARVVWLILRQSLEMIVVGVAIGLVAAYVAERVLYRVVEGMTPVGPAAVAMTVPVLVVAALLASVVPALKAGKVSLRSLST